MNPIVFFFVLSQVSTIRSEPPPTITCSQAVAAKWIGGDKKEKSGWRKWGGDFEFIWTAYWGTYTTYSHIIMRLIPSSLSVLIPIIDCSEKGNSAEQVFWCTERVQGAGRCCLPYTYLSYEHSRKAIWRRWNGSTDLLTFCCLSNHQLHWRVKIWTILARSWNLNRTVPWVTLEFLMHPHRVHLRRRQLPQNVRWMARQRSDWISTDYWSLPAIVWKFYAKTRIILPH